MNQGRIIEYIDEGRFVCSVCIQDKGARLHLLTMANREVNLPLKRSVLISDRVLNTDRPKEELIDQLRQADTRRSALETRVDVRELWGLVKGEAEHFSHNYLAQLVFEGPVSDDHLSALVRALFRDHLYFKFKDGRFLPNPEDRVEQIVAQRKEEVLREKRLSEGSSWLKQVLLGGTPQPPDCREEVVGLLTGLALQGDDAPDFKAAKELLNRTGISDIGESRKLLVALGIWEPDENVDLLKMGVVAEFTRDEEEECARLSHRRPSAEGREDLRELPVVTIDGPMTLDFDDAISLESDGDSVTVGLHIADVSSHVLPGTLLDVTASERGSSLYLPRKQIPMLPEALSHNALSLLEGQERQAFSLMVRFDGTRSPAEYRFVPSMIRVRHRLTYDEVNERVGGDAFVAQLFDLCKQLRSRRIAAGGLHLSLPELQVEFLEDGSPRIGTVDQDSPSRMIVGELMILHNWLAGKFFRDNRIPGLYRTQAEPSERVSRGDTTGYLYYVFRQRRKLSPLQLSVSPGPHAGLGLDVYTQASSPIRRYLDLVVQRQLAAFLAGTGPVYSGEQLEAMRLRLEPVLRGLERIKRNRTRYWILKYLGQRRGGKYKAVVLDELRNKYRIVLDGFYLVAEIKRKNGMILSPGQEIVVEVRKSDPWEDVLELNYLDS
jgi:exoribonuclease-2